VVRAAPIRPEEPKVSTHNQPTSNPTRKVTAGALGGAGMVVVAYALEAAAGLELPAAVVAAGTTIVSFALSYVVKERDV
jgi:hypothetical protein